VINVYVRHLKSCEHYQDAQCRKCRCPKWLMGVPEGGGRFIRKSAKTSSWDVALKLARQLNQESIAKKTGTFKEKSGETEIATAIKQFLAKKRKENSSESTVDIYTTVLQRQFLPWCQNRALVFMGQLTPDALQSVSEIWENGRRWSKKDQGQGNRSSTARIKYTRLNTFLKYAVERHWLEENPLPVAFKRPKLLQEDVRETQPLDPDEMKKIVDRTYLPIPGSHAGEEHRTKTRALLLLLRYSGLSIWDGIKLARKQLRPNGALVVRRTKTGNPVQVMLPPRVVKLLRRLPNKPSDYFFWDGQVGRKSATDNWRHILQNLARLAGIERHFHPHMLRDTFVVEQLLKGTSYEDVAEMIGDSSAIVIKHYSPLVKARRERLAELSKKGWDDGEIWIEPADLPTKSASIN
jgi:site-specific recombinase XerD